MQGRAGWIECRGRKLRKSSIYFVGTTVGLAAGLDGGRGKEMKDDF